MEGKVVIIAVFADGGGGGYGDNTNDNKNAVFLYISLLGWKACMDSVAKFLVTDWGI